MLILACSAINAAPVTSNGFSVCQCMYSIMQFYRTMLLTDSCVVQNFQIELQKAISFCTLSFTPFIIIIIPNITLFVVCNWCDCAFIYIWDCNRMFVFQLFLEISYSIDNNCCCLVLMRRIQQLQNMQRREKVTQIYLKQKEKRRRRS